MFSRINTAVCMGVEGRCVTVETDIGNGLPNMNIVGLASTTVMEARERIRAAIVNSGFEYPRGRITVNLTPADTRKNGSYLDLPIAIGVLASNLYVDAGRSREYGIIGALSLDGEVLGVESLLPMIMCMADSGIRRLIVPAANYREAGVLKDIRIIPVTSLTECVSIINGYVSEDGLPGASDDTDMNDQINAAHTIDFRDIRGQEAAKRAITIAVAGRHGLLMVGSPGCGKTMLAKRIPSIMPPMSQRELLETAIIYSVEGKNNRDGSICYERPFRSPHSSIGRAGLLGGGHSMPIPGEITLAHNGVLFLDEVCEFERDKIESLRLPIEDKKITHIRNGEVYTFPCNFQLVMAANPCKCGYYGDSDHMCKCTQPQLEQYRRKLSGPMMDRIDMRIQMEKVSYSDISSKESSDTGSEEMREMVSRAMSFAAASGRSKANGDMTDGEIEKYCILGSDEAELMRRAYSGLGLSPRSYRKILKVARTIADLDESTEIRTEHLAEAISYRMLTEINSSS